MAVEIDVRKLGLRLFEPGAPPAPVTSPPRSAEPLPFERRRGLSLRRRRRQRLYQGLTTAGWVGGSAALILVAAAGVLGLH